MGHLALVQDGGVPGTVSNLAFLLVIGAATEQVLAHSGALLRIPSYDEGSRALTGSAPHSAIIRLRMSWTNPLQSSSPKSVR
jgi:hypothetical protein